MAKKPDVDYDGQLSKDYSAGRGITAEAEATWRSATASHFDGASSIADVGAGTGRWAVLIDGLDTQAQTYAVEPAAGMRGQGRTVAASPSLSWIGASAEQLPFADRSVDVVWTAFATHYFDIPEAAAEFERVLAPGGRVLIWHVYRDMMDDLAWFRWFPAARKSDDKRMSTREEVCDAFDAAGLELTEDSVHQMLITENQAALAERLSHRSISTLRLISDEDFEAGMADLRAHVATTEPAPVYAPNALLVFERCSGV